MSKNIQTALNFLKGYQTGAGYAGVKQFCAANATFESDCYPLKTVEEYTNFCAIFYNDMCPNTKFDVLSSAEAGDKVFVHCGCHFKNTGTTGPFPPSGKEIDVKYVEIFTFDQEGKVSHLYKLVNQYPLFSTFGYPQPSPNAPYPPEN